MTMENSDRIISRYSGLARAAIAGQAISDCDPDTFDDGQASVPPLTPIASQGRTRNRHSRQAWAAATR